MTAATSTSSNLMPRCSIGRGGTISRSRSCARVSGRPWRSIHPTNDPLARLGPPPAVVEHGVRLAHARRRSQIGAQPSRLAVPMLLRRLAHRAIVARTSLVGTRRRRPATGPSPAGRRPAPEATSPARRPAPPTRASPRLGVSVLSADHEVACRQLASRDGDRFAGLDWEYADGGAISLPGTPLVLGCSLEAELPAGDHRIALLRIHGLTTDITIAPLDSTPAGSSSSRREAPGEPRTPRAADLAGAGGGHGHRVFTGGVEPAGRRRCGGWHRVTIGGRPAQPRPVRLIGPTRKFRLRSTRPRSG
jgi:hypothetical protein